MVFFGHLKVQIVWLHVSSLYLESPEQQLGWTQLTWLQAKFGSAPPPFGDSTTSLPATLFPVGPLRPNRTLTQPRASIAIWGAITGDVEEYLVAASLRT